MCTSHKRRPSIFRTESDLSVSMNVINCTGHWVADHFIAVAAWLRITANGNAHQIILHCQNDRVSGSCACLHDTYICEEQRNPPLKENEIINLIFTLSVFPILQMHFSRLINYKRRAK